MRKRILYPCLALWCLFFFGAKPVSQEELALGFAQRHLGLARHYCQSAGIPNSITLGMAIRESAFGRSELAQNANNYFGIKADAKRWKGPTYLKTDDEYDADGNLIFSSFRKYPSASHSFADYAAFLKKGKNYAGLFALSSKDYASWAYGLKKAGYATSPTYAPDLIATIERYRLHRFDVQTSPMPVERFAEKEETPVKRVSPKKPNKKTTLKKYSKPQTRTMRKPPHKKLRKKASSKTCAKRRAVK